MGSFNNSPQWLPSILLLLLLVFHSHFYDHNFPPGVEVGNLNHAVLLVAVGQRHQHIKATLRIFATVSITILQHHLRQRGTGSAHKLPVLLSQLTLTVTNGGPSWTESSVCFLHCQHCTEKPYWHHALSAFLSQCDALFLSTCVYFSIYVIDPHTIPHKSKVNSHFICIWIWCGKI